MIAVSRKWKGRMLIGCMVGFALYALLNILAMVFYPGGTSVDSRRVGYSLVENYFSDLGMAATYAGESNAPSQWLFASALVLVGIVLIIFFLLLASYFTGSRLERYSSRIGSASGILAGLACMGIAATPWDLYLGMHLVFVSLLSFALLVVFISYSIAILGNRRYPHWYAWVFVSYGCVLAAYVALMVAGPDIDTPSGSRIMATGQKILIYSGMLCLFVQVLGAFAYNRRDGFGQAA